MWAWVWAWGGGRVTWWTLDSRKGCCCARVCICADSHAAPHIVVRGCCIGRKSSIYLWSALELKHIRADMKRESKEHRGKMEANIFRGRVEEIPPSRAHVSAATWLILADYFSQKNACRDVCFPSVSCDINIYWSSLFLIGYIQTNQAYFPRLKAHNRDDYVSIYRLRGGSSVWLLNFVFHCWFIL